MKFVDQVQIQVKAGDGGNGAIAFRREKYVERGGPCGGDGGNGGSVVFRADPQLTTLLDFRYRPLHHAKNGEGGLGSDCNGRGAEDLVLRVPVGTLLKDAESGTILHDLSVADQEVVIAKGGRGGLGNINFANSRRQTPRFAQDGTPGEEKTLLLELKLLADVGLLGFPNAGKSTLISRISRAKPKIADYPFTTLVPNLGMVQYKDGQSFVVADIPGLIEGASEGHGLGHQFLRHVERCRVLIHLVDLSAEGEGREPLADYEIINRELLRFSETLAEKPQIVVANKVDLPDAKEKLAPFAAALAKEGVKVFALSSITGEGLRELVDVAARVLYGGPDQLPSVDGEKRPRNRVKAKVAEEAKAVAESAPAPFLPEEDEKRPRNRVRVRPAEHLGATADNGSELPSAIALSTTGSNGSESKSAASKSAASKASASKSDASKASASKPGASKPGASKSGASKSGASKSGASKSAGSKSKAAASKAKSSASKSRTAGSKSKAAASKSKASGSKSKAAASKSKTGASKAKSAASKSKKPAARAR